MPAHPLTLECAEAVALGADAARDLRDLLCRAADCHDDHDAWAGLNAVADTAHALAEELYALAWRVRRGAYDPHPAD